MDQRTDPPPPQRFALEPEGTAGQISSLLTGERSLVVEAPGFGMDSRQVSFRMPWAAVAQVSVVHKRRYRGGELLRGMTDDVQLLVLLADDEPARRQPEFAQLRGVGVAQGTEGYGVLLGPVPHLVEPMAAAFATFAGPRFTGVQVVEQ